MLRLIFGHSKSGKSSRIFEMMKKDAECGRRSFLIVPEQQTVQCERAMLALLPPSAQLTSEVLNFSRLANLVFRHYGGLSYNYANRGCKTLIMWKELCDLAPMLHEYSSVAHGPRSISLACEMLSAVTELKAYCVSPEKLENAAEKITDNDILKNKLMDIALICGAYNAALAESYSDSSDDLSKLADKLAKHDFFAGANVYIDSFTSFTAQELRVIGEILKSADELTVALTLDGLSSTQIHYESTADTALRLMSLARHLSKETETVKLPRAVGLPRSLEAICNSLWQPDVRDLSDVDPSDTIRIISVANPYDEAEAVANIIRDLMMKGARCSEITIVARDASQYRGIIDVALEKAEIPYFFSQSTEILSKPLIKFLLAALRIKIYNWRTEDVITYMKTGLADLDPDDVDLFECYCTVWRISGAARFNEPWTMNPDGFSGYLTDSGRAALSKVNAMKESFIPRLNALFARLDASESAADMCRALFLFMEEYSISDKLSTKAAEEYAVGRRREAAELLQLYNTVITALENIAQSISDSECSVREFADAFKIILDNTSLNTIPTARDQVTVGSASMLRADGIKYAILIGLNEGEFPQNVKESGIFSNNDKKALDTLGISLSPDTSARSSEELFYVYRAMTLPTEGLILISHECDLSGSPTPPSTALTRIRNLFPSIRTERYSDFPASKCILSKAIASEKLRNCQGDAFSEAFKRFADKHPRELKLSNYSDVPIRNLECKLPRESETKPLHLTQTLMDSYIACPFEYMCTRILNLKDTRQADFDYNNFGTYVHYVFENLLRVASADRVIGLEPNDEYLSELVEKIAQKYLYEAFPGGEASSRRLFYRFERMKRVAKLVASSMLSEFADSSFRPEFFELPIGRPGGNLSLAPLILRTPNGRPIHLSGKIDRVDLCRSENTDDILVRVVDYKSGKKQFRLDRIENGENLQLPLYLFALCDKDQSAFARLINAKGELVPAGAMYLSSLIPPINVSNGKDIADEAKRSIPRSGFIRNDMDILLKMSASLSPQYLCGAKLTKDGKASGSALVLPEHMTALRNDLSTAIIGIGEKITDGNMSCSPSFDGQSCRCERCAMKSVCRSAMLFKK